MKTFLITLLYIFSSAIHASNSWPEWEHFKSIYISPDGRVIDGSTDQMITTSEGQAYGLFFALVANDKQTFSNILEWTENNLSNHDLAKNLPVWSTGIDKNSKKLMVLDSNSAADADLWIAYVLGEAGRLWGNFEYKSLAYLLSKQILQNESIYITNFGWMLLPGAQGFNVDEKTWKLNPSYLPIQILRRFSVLYPHSPWQEITNNCIKLLYSSSPLGYAVDWVLFNEVNQILLNNKDRNVGGYNAIRVYLWLGMLNNDDQDKQALIAHYSPFLETIIKDKNVYEYYDIKLKKQVGSIPNGFNSAVLPILTSANNLNLAKEFVSTKSFIVDSSSPDHYYDFVLTLFGKGWLDNRFSFDKNGQLTIKSE